MSHFRLSGSRILMKFHPHYAAQTSTLAPKVCGYSGVHARHPAISCECNEHKAKTWKARLHTALPISPVPIRGAIRSFPVPAPGGSSNSPVSLSRVTGHGNVLRPAFF